MFRPRFLSLNFFSWIKPVLNFSSCGSCVKAISQTFVQISFSNLHATCPPSLIRSPLETIMCLPRNTALTGKCVLIVGDLLESTHIARSQSDIVSAVHFEVDTIVSSFAVLCVRHEDWIWPSSNYSQGTWQCWTIYLYAVMC
jgi:hypothetical protein